MASSMTFDDYQKAALRTLSESADLASLALGFAGESGEICDQVKKIIAHGHLLDDHRDKIAEEIGDVLWYCAAMAERLEINLDEIAIANIEKLKIRYPDGFDQQASRSRYPKKA